ncbi:Z-ring positioning protein MinD [Vibrio chagasii]|nr:Z-ring positioning protein MinD [Vibrio chagasii]
MKIITVTSGKGGVGKSTTSAALALALARSGKKTCVIDFDVGLRNLDLLMGLERRVVFDFINLCNGEATIKQGLIKYDKEKGVDNCYMIAASQTKDKNALTTEGVEYVMNELKELDFEYVICDSPAGIENGALHALYLADEAIVVVNPEVSSIQDSDRIIGMLGTKTKRAENGQDGPKLHLVVNRYDLNRVKQGSMVSLDMIGDILGNIPLLGVIPLRDKEVLEHSNKGRPLSVSQGDVGKAYCDAALRLIGEDVPMKFVEEKGLFARLFGSNK